MSPSAGKAAKKSETKTPKARGWGLLLKGRVQLERGKGKEREVTLWVSLGESLIAEVNKAGLGANRMTTQILLHHGKGPLVQTPKIPGETYARRSTGWLPYALYEELVAREKLGQSLDSFCNARVRAELDHPTLDFPKRQAAAAPKTKTKGKTSKATKAPKTTPTPKPARKSKRQEADAKLLREVPPVVPRMPSVQKSGPMKGDFQPELKAPSA
jgi:hypothetical protein